MQEQKKQIKYQMLPLGNSYDLNDSYEAKLFDK
jgi:hypothetical protein